MKLVDDGDGDDFLARAAARIEERTRENDTPERRAELARAAAAAERDKRMERARTAGVPRDASVWPFVINEQAIETEAYQAATSLLAGYDSDYRETGVPRSRTLFVGADFGRAKTSGVCAACVRSKRSFLYREAHMLPSDSYDATEEWGRLRNVEILVIDDIEIAPVKSHEPIRLLIRRRHRNGLVTFIVGNVTRLRVAEQFVDRAMMSSLEEQESRFGQPWFVPAPTDSGRYGSKTDAGMNPVGSLGGPSFRQS